MHDRLVFRFLFHLFSSLVPRHGSQALVRVHYWSWFLSTEYNRAGICDLGHVGFESFFSLDANAEYGTFKSVLWYRVVGDQVEWSRRQRKWQSEVGIIGKFHQRASCLGNSYPTPRSPLVLREPRRGRSGVPLRTESPSVARTPDAAE